MKRIGGGKPTIERAMTGKPHGNLSDAIWNTSKHPRGPGGKFAVSGGASSIEVVKPRKSKVPLRGNMHMNNLSYRHRIYLARTRDLRSR